MKLTPRRAGAAFVVPPVASGGCGQGNAHRPFCSLTCRLIDLGVWLDERYRIPSGERFASDRVSSEPHDHVP